MIKCPGLQALVLNHPIMNAALVVALETELAYRGPERRGAENAGLVRLMAAVLDEVDYGLMLLSADGLVVHANHAVLREMGSTHPLELRSRRLRSREPLEQQLLADALEAARHRGVRCMLSQASGNAVLMTLQRSQLVEKLSVGAFARARGLSQREEEVLTALCEGLRPTQIAERMGVAVATVRSHVHNLKEKTHCRSMVELVKQIALLPPLVTALKTPSRMS
jgi:DNA-binding CsgD family transcriptional regulator